MPDHDPTRKRGHSTERTENGWRIGAFTILGLVEAALVFKVLTLTGTDVALVTAILAVGVLLLLVPRLYDIKSLGYGKMKAELESFQKKLDVTDEKVNQLWMLSMWGPIYDNLKKISSGDFGEYVMGEGLRRDLYHLRDHGYIDVMGVSKIPSPGRQLSEFVKITPAGQAFIDRRERG